MGHVCSAKHVRTFDNSLRLLVHRPKVVFGPYVKEGMTVLDVGCGAGFASLAMAKMVGDKGKVIAVDLQREMLEILRKRAEKTGLNRRIRLQQCEADSLGVEDKVDFVNAFWMVHEVPDSQRFLAQVHEHMKTDGRFLLVEPRHHVPEPAFEKTARLALEVGFKLVDRPKLALSRAIVLAYN